MQTTDLLVDRCANLPDVTFGHLMGPEDLSLVTLERPWKDNQSNISCIPAGEYQWEHWTRPSGDHVIIIHNQDDTTKPPGQRIWKTKADGDKYGARWGILCHVANFPDDVEGCFAIGMRIGSTWNDSKNRCDHAVLTSGGAMVTLLRALEDYQGGQFSVRYQGAPQWP